MKKFELTDETIIHNGRILHRIKALKNFGDIQSGKLGGYVEKEDNLSQSGDAWLYDDAKVYGNTMVYDNARVYGNAEVNGNARVYGDARVYGNAWVYGNAIVSGNAEVNGNTKVNGNAMVSGNADYTTIKGFETKYRDTTFFRTKDNKICVVCGCFSGTIEEFRKQVKRTRSGKIAKEYLAIADLMELHFKKIK